MKNITRFALCYALTLIVIGFVLLLCLRHFAGGSTAVALIFPISLIATVCLSYSVIVSLIYDKLLTAQSHILPTFNTAVGVCRLLLAAIGLGIYALVAGKAHLVAFAICLAVYYFSAVIAMTYRSMRKERQQIATNR